MDFFTPIVDEPYMFGQIAAANSLSDVYAMGGEPRLALNIAGFPNCLDSSILAEILAGGADKVKEAGAVLVGGHTIQDDEPKYGLCVAGFVHPKKIWKNYGSRPGDVLILTKQIGNGIVNTAIKAQMADEESIKEAQVVMASLNKKAKEVVDEGRNIRACTDITGFGLLGHCAEMAVASEVTFQLNVKKIPFVKGADEYAKMGLVPAGAYQNREYSGKYVDPGKAMEYEQDLLYDPQTSGGLLLSVPKELADDVMEKFESKHMDTKVAVIGQVVEKEPDANYIRLI